MLAGERLGADQLVGAPSEPLPVLEAESVLAWGVSLAGQGSPGPAFRQASAFE